MNLEELRKKASALPFDPGVYIMRDKRNNVIYVGKAKKLKNRVSQYFQDTASHSPKTRLMVSHIHEFDVIVSGSEFEALVLECSLIKRHMPKYNILLKDDKGYPYLRLDMNEDYPKITLVNKIAHDGAEYFGPYGSRGVTQKVLKTVCSTLMLPDCSKCFPRDVGKGRPCLNYHMKQCAGWCQNISDINEYRKAIAQARQLLQGKFRHTADQIREDMLRAADELNFELAADLRNRLNAVEALGKKQSVSALSLADTDAIGFAQTEAKACFTVLHFGNGQLLDKEYQIMEAVEDPAIALSSLVKQYYISKGHAPKNILLPFEIEDSALFAQLLHQNYGRKVEIKTPQRGENLRLLELAAKNAQDEAQRATSKEEASRGILTLLGKMLAIASPNRIEAFDISNISGTDTVASMVVFVDGKPKKSEYKRFKIRDLQQQDDYESMRQVVERRFLRYQNRDSGFDVLPDLLLIDGGISHAATAQEILNKLEISVPVFGMVKDDRHRTRALVTPSGGLISIDTQQNIFAFIGTIQEETHRFAISYHRKLRSKRLQYSILDEIPGIGKKRKEDLLRTFKSMRAISSAELQELERILPKNTAQAVYNHFRKNIQEGGE